MRQYFISVVLLTGTAVAADFGADLRACTSMADEVQRRQCFAEFEERTRPRPPAPAAPVVSPEEGCKAAFDLASAIMTARQNGASMPEVVGIFESGDLGVAVSRDAFSRPRFTLESFQAEAIRDFANEYYAACLNLADTLQP